MIQLMPSEPGAYRVVDFIDLYDLTRHGWQLVAVLTQDEVQTVRELLPPDHLAMVKDQGRYGTSPNTHWDKPVVKQVKKFLVRQVKDDLLAELHADIKKFREQSEENYGDATSARNALIEEQKVRAEAENQLAAERKLKDGIYGQLEANQTARRKLEGDIAKLRTAIGDLRMKEILG